MNYIGESAILLCAPLFDGSSSMHSKNMKNIDKSEFLNEDGKNARQREKKAYKMKNTSSLHVDSRFSVLTGRISVTRLSAAPTLAVEVSRLSLNQPTEKSDVSFVRSLRIVQTVNTTHNRQRQCCQQSTTAAFVWSRVRGAERNEPTESPRKQNKTKTIRLSSRPKYQQETLILLLV